MKRSTQRTIAIGCIVIALLALPFIDMMHCEVEHAVDDHASTPLAEACCVFLCLTVLVSALALHRSWMSITHVMLALTPVRLVSPLARWVPPPRPIAFLFQIVHPF
jgi:hypothetical protein